MKRSLFDRRIPTLLALALLVIGIAVTSFLTSKTLQITGFASPDEKPQNVRISNITDTAFTITYTSEKAVLGSITYGITADNLKEITFDDRDQQGSTPKPYQTHSITLRNLKAQTQYYFSITSGESVYVSDGKPYTATTAKTLSATKPEKWDIAGTILLSDGKAAEDTIVYFTTINGQSLSTLTRNGGKFSLTTLGMKNSSLTTYLTLLKETRVDLIALSGILSTHAQFTLENSNPLPDITLSQNYDFTLSEPLLPENAASESAVATFPFLGTQATEVTKIEITSPKKDERFTDQQPKFEGSAAPSQNVDILIESDNEIRASVTASKQGLWSFRPDKPLTPGNHTITMTTRDSNNLLRTLSRTFVVLAEGSQFVDPSVSPTKLTTTPSPTQTQTPTPSPALTQAVSITPSPTEVLVLTETPTPSVTQSPVTTDASITPRPTIQPTGTSSLSSLTLISIAITISGIILLILTRGGAPL